MEELTIRSATVSDLDELLELRLSLQRHVEASSPWIWRITEEGRRRLQQELEKMLADSGGRMVVAVKDGELVGFAYGQVFNRETYVPLSVGHISMIYVQEGFRRRGVGSRLVEELCRFFRSENVEDVTLRYALGNREAERFWRGLGFEPIMQTVNIHLEELEERLRESASAGGH
jgi:ribosomal protein S18 acetylase RimI-like enzyme